MLTPFFEHHYVRTQSVNESGSTPRFETEILAAEDNLEALALINGAWVARAMSSTEAKRVILDMDSSESPVHGKQEGSAYNGHFKSVCYHPLFVFNQHGDCEGAALRPGNVHSADGWLALLEPIVDRYRDKGRKLYFRADAAFASPDVYEYMEDNGILYVMRMISNPRLDKEIEHLLTRPVGRPPKKPQVFYHDFLYRAASWDRSRRVIAKVEWHRGELLPKVGFIVTNLSKNAKNAFRFYNQRGNCERFIKEGKYAITWTRLSCLRFIPNRVRLSLFILAYNLGNFLRRFALPREVSSWSLSSIQLKLVKIGAKVISHARRTIFQLAEVAVSEALFVKILARIHGLRYAPG